MPEKKGHGVPILLYHRFAVTSSTTTTVTVDEFKSQMAWIKENGFNVIPLAQLVDAYQGKAPFPSPGSIVIVIDDGHRSFYDKAYEILKSYGFTATLFVYPLDVGHNSTMTWSQLEELKINGFSIQSHTFSHLNIKKVRGDMDSDSYEKLINAELLVSKMVLEGKLGVEVDCLAYPYGNFDNAMLKEAIEAGYAAAFTIDPRPNFPGDAPQRLSRYTIVPGMSQKTFARILDTSRPKPDQGPFLPFAGKQTAPAPPNDLLGQRDNTSIPAIRHD
ncbi:MAG: polysaccharide deacetylase family protein [Nitrospirota bacterium]|nr:polysaccharide deacetylase family protein [Nitrospirota bacterium]